MYSLIYYYMLNFFPYISIQQLKLVSKKYKFSVKRIYTDKFDYLAYFFETKYHYSNYTQRVILLRRNKLLRYKIDTEQWRLEYILSTAMHSKIFDICEALVPRAKDFTVIINYAMTNEHIDIILEHENIFVVDHDFIPNMLNRNFYDPLKYFLTKRPQSIFINKYWYQDIGILTLDIVNFFYDNKISYDVEELIPYFRHLKKTDVYQVLIKQLIWQNGLP